MKRIIPLAAAARASARSQNKAVMVFLLAALAAFIPVRADLTGTPSLAWRQTYTGLTDPIGRNDTAKKTAIDASGNVIVTGTSNGDYYTAKYAAADGALLWEKRYNSLFNGNDEARALTLDASGNVIVTGLSEGNGGDYVTVKYAALDGGLLWERRYDSPAHDTDDPISVAVDGAGNVAVTGYSINASRYVDYYTAKYAAANGALLWEKSYSVSPVSTNRPAAVAMDGTGNVVVTGMSYDGATTDFYTAKYAAADGGLVWEKRTGGPQFSFRAARALAIDNSGNVLVTGYARDTQNATDVDCYTIKYAVVDGAILWEKRYNSPVNNADVANGVVVDTSGNAIITGISSNGDYYTAKYAAADGALLWERSYNGPANSIDESLAVSVDGSGNVAVTGSSRNASNTDYYTAKYAAANGALLWEKTYNGPANLDDDAASVAMDGNGNVIVTGTSRNSGDADYNQDYYTAKYSAADGTLLWEKRYNPPARLANEARAVAAFGNGDVVVTGSSQRSIVSGAFDWYTARYAAVNGALMWEKRYTGLISATPTTQIPSSVAVDGSGNVIVTGSSSNTPSVNPDYFTAKYAGADGSLLWEKRYNGPASNQDVANALAIDGNGNVIVTGRSRATINDDYYTAKYAAADGALLWEKRYSGPGDRPDIASAVAVDSGGNVIVTGDSPNTITAREEYYTAKYAAATGALLWEKRYSAPNDKRSYATAIALDGSGNVIVTGKSYNAADNLDYYTAKYAAANGSLLWERRYNGPANGDDSPTSLAVDVSGNVVVTGNSFNGINTDIFTTAYAAADGAVLWEFRHGGNPDYPQTAADLALDASGNVLIAGSVSDSSQDYLVLKITTALTPLQSWRLSNFGTTSNTGNAADTADYDFDGVKNLLEFAFGTVPGGFGGNASGPRALTYAGNVIAAGNITTEFFGGIPRAEFIRRADYLAAGLTYTVSFSADLNTWVPSGTAPGVIATDGILQVVAIPYPILPGGAQARFFTVTVNTQP